MLFCSFLVAAILPSKQFFCRGDPSIVAILLSQQSFRRGNPSVVATLPSWQSFVIRDFQHFRRVNLFVAHQQI
jgi:hypothetical protein